MKSAPALLVVVVMLVGGVQFAGSPLAGAPTGSGTHASTSVVVPVDEGSPAGIDPPSGPLQDDGDGSADGAGPTPAASPAPTRRRTSSPPSTGTPASSPFRIVDARLDQRQVVADGTVEVTVTVENTGNSTTLYQAELRVGGVAVDTRTVSVGAGASETVTFERVFHDPGHYEIAVGSTTIGTVTVEAPAGAVEGDGRVGIVDVAGLPDWVRAGSDTSVRAVVVNEGNGTARRTLTVTVDGAPVANETVALVPGERATVTIEFDAAEGVVAVDGVEAGRVDVGETLGPGGTPAGTGRAPPGVASRLGLLLPVLAVLTLVVGAVRVARRRR